MTSTPSCTMECFRKFIIRYMCEVIDIISFDPLVQHKKPGKSIEFCPVKGENSPRVVIPWLLHCRNVRPHSEDQR
jgi:hypothetical protein